MKSTSDQKILNRFGAHLKQLRELGGFSLRKLADEADVDFSMIHRIEKGESNPSLLMMVSLAEALKIPLSDLINF